MQGILYAVGFCSAFLLQGLATYIAKLVWFAATFSISTSGIILVMS